MDKVLNLEKRYLNTANVGGFKTREENGKTIVRGYSAKFNSMSEDLGGYREIIDPAFFDDVLNDDVRALWNHKSELLLGRSTAETLKYGVDAVGLWFEYEDPGTSYSRDLLISMSRGDVKECSFQFEVRSSSDGGYKFERKGEEWFCTLLKCKRLYDVGPVTFPAYPETTIGVRGLAEAKAQFERQITPDFSRSVDRIKILQSQF
jgi:HK97 family phage prohead protease